MRPKYNFSGHFSHELFTKISIGCWLSLLIWMDNNLVPRLSMGGWRRALVKMHACAVSVYQALSKEPGYEARWIIA